jgi:hypothetical protein
VTLLQPKRNTIEVLAKLMDENEGEHAGSPYNQGEHAGSPLLK